MGLEKVCPKCGLELQDWVKVCPDCGTTLIEKKAFCRSCGKELPNETDICMSCGVRPPVGNKFCPRCGVAVLPEAELCVNCKMYLSKDEKSKATSVLLAVFLGWWTWLYTYKKDAWKFWIGLCVVIVGGILLLIGSPSFYLIIGIGSLLWIWAVVDTATKSDEWYKSF
jgi:predicted RNA-binding Zn-ribbon protein involved in translation (DUF1610 family)